MFAHGFAVFNDGLIKGGITSDDGDILRLFVLGLYAVVLGVLWMYGMHRYHIMSLFKKHRNDVPVPPREYTEEELPPVTVQLAVFNEMYVVERLIDCICKLDYPRDRFQVQLVDDSTDETKQIVANRVAEWRRQGVDIQHVHRTNRVGYKAGALDNALATATGEFIVMFDADFLPAPDFIRRQIHHFNDENVGFVQARWAHLNESHSLLTRLQAIFLNGHFVLDHTARQRSGRFFSFSGTAGTWRKAAIADAGGWQHDTLVEDLDLSYRVQMGRWHGIYNLDQPVNAELPVDMNAFKSQQHRWAKGFIQGMKKLLIPIWKSKQPLKVKIECTFHLTNNLSYLFVVALCVLLLPALFYRSHLLSGAWAVVFDLSLFFGATVSMLVFYVFAEKQLGGKWWRKLIYMPFILGLGVALCINQSKAVLEALFNQVSPFVRTPKFQVIDGETSRSTWEAKKYSVKRNMIPFMELFMAVYFAGVMGYAIWQEVWMAVPFLFLFFWGFSYVGGMSLWQQRRRTTRVTTAMPLTAEA